ncbi:isochorismatase hydrolase [Histoplasma ohiense]|nr:isochorismatase hydrolase [Histoplasma ohiense (nom. inval.)]
MVGMCGVGLMRAMRIYNVLRKIPWGSLGGQVGNDQLKNWSMASPAEYQNVKRRICLEHGLVMKNPSFVLIQLLMEPENAHHASIDFR